eukprot:CAMPEP_0198496206 /NCGR_PEP_ID=MMETSP1462-20131121/5682_1 /TAXON_ID=1333877 /ORGANISM="Brandtodinium nutriculum, Strain RCC3387" /LENGTH=382 /DNA_ID=CAMNT_0044225027 /DNA_START=52 /DNA_END=1196 /DNA_ORIENTATION=+
MRIKQVIIRGFKTYKEQVSLVEDFHPAVNAIVGLNGSGKSNFFNAILFVISDHFGTLRPETRKTLLHEGAGPAVLTAFVELVFDNADRRMPIDKGEVRIRRTIAAKKDDYMLDGKHATKTEVFNLLESCGFTKSNPYYVVQQGKIAELTLMNDSRRLELIKDISGASVYDDRRAESFKVLEDVRCRRQKTDEVIDGIRRRIEGLEDEQRELADYQRLERERRCLEFELSDRDWRAAQDRIDATQVDLRDVGARLEEAQRAATALRMEASRAELDTQQLSAARQGLATEREEAEKSRAARVDDLARAQTELAHERARAKAGDKARRDAETDLARLREEVVQAEREVAEARESFDKELSQQRDLARRRQQLGARRDQLLAAHGG